MKQSDETLEHIPYVTPELLAQFKTYRDTTSDDVRFRDIMDSNLRFLLFNADAWPTCRYTLTEYTTILKNAFVTKTHADLENVEFDWSVLPLFTHEHMGLLPADPNDLNSEGPYWSDAIARYLHGHILTE
jgi:hypothetical protein